MFRVTEAVNNTVVYRFVTNVLAANCTNAIEKITVGFGFYISVTG